ncbi:MAG TPA: hypothetical protein VGA71_02245 [Actinomycetota bacterium]
MITPRWRKVALVVVVGAAWLLAGCSKSSSPTTATTAPATTPATTIPSTAGSRPTPAATPAPSGSDAEQQDLQQAQRDIADLEKALSQVDSGLNANQQTEGDVNP